MQIIKTVECCEAKNRNGETILKFDNSPTVSISCESDNFNENLSSLIAATNAVGTTAQQAGEALSRLTSALAKYNISLVDKTDHYKDTLSVIEDIADAWNAIGCTSFYIQPDEANAIKENAINMIQASKGIELPRPETPATTENPNEKSPFDFLEQNAYNEIKPIFDDEESGWINSLDSM